MGVFLARGYESMPVQAPIGSKSWRWGGPLFTCFVWPHVAHWSIREDLRTLITVQEVTYVERIALSLNMVWVFH